MVLSPPAFPNGLSCSESACKVTDGAPGTVKAALVRPWLCLQTTPSASYMFPFPRLQGLCTCFSKDPNSSKTHCQPLLKCHLLSEAVPSLPAFASVACLSTVFYLARSSSSHSSPAPAPPSLPLPLICLWLSCRDGTLGLVHTRQALYHLVIPLTSPSLAKVPGTQCFCLVYH